MLTHAAQDYAITKPGMPPVLLRKRDKPLRTYGRRSTATPEPRGEPPAKRSRIDTNDGSPQSAVMHSKQIEDIDNASTTGEERASEPITVPSQPRTSILSYFKPIEGSARKTRSQKRQEKQEEHEVSTESSIRSRVRRGPRLLRIRATARPLAGGNEDMNETCSDDASPESPTKKRRGLKEGGDSLLNQDRSQSGSGQASTGSKSKRPPTVQTTLNISSRAAFEECKICDTVWNPLYPDDVKFHTNRHARVLRAKRKLAEQAP